MRLILVRHGEAEETWLPDLGHGDPPLSATGQRQTEALAAELRYLARRTQTPAAVYTSPFRAARDTAVRIADALGLDGARTSEGLGTLTPEVLPEGGGLDAIAALQQNVWSAVESLKELHTDEADLVLVSHDLPIRALVCGALSVPLSEMRRFAASPASLTTIWFRGPRTLLAGLNDTCHLERAGGRFANEPRHPPV